MKRDINEKVVGTALGWFLELLDARLRYEQKRAEYAAGELLKMNIRVELTLPLLGLREGACDAK